MKEIAVVFDVAGTLLRMYRVAKDIPRGCLLEGVVTIELIMQKDGRALVVPQIDPQEVASAPPETPLGELFREDLLEVSCSSTPVDKAEAWSILRSSKAVARDLQEACWAIRSRCPGPYRTTGVIVDSDTREVAYAVSTGGVPFPGAGDVLERLKSLGAEIYVASGDSMRSLSGLSELGISPDRICAAASPKRKSDLILKLKDKYRKVVMVGDGLNDIYALRAADIGVLTVQQESRPPSRLLEAADIITQDISELPEIVRKGIKLIV